MTECILQHYWWKLTLISLIGSLGHKECKPDVWANQEEAQSHGCFPTPSFHPPALSPDALWVSAVNCRPFCILISQHHIQSCSGLQKWIFGMGCWGLGRQYTHLHAMRTFYIFNMHAQTFQWCHSELHLTLRKPGQALIGLCRPGLWLEGCPWSLGSLGASSWVCVLPKAGRCNLLHDREGCWWLPEHTATQSSCSAHIHLQHPPYCIKPKSWQQLDFGAERVERLQSRCRICCRGRQNDESGCFEQFYRIQLLTYMVPRRLWFSTTIRWFSTTIH